jgi:C1A family cysteine protease
MSEKFKHGLGWLPDEDDDRDYTDETEGVKEVLDALTPEAEKPGCLGAVIPASPSAQVDLSGDFPPVWDQGDLGSCTAQAAAALIQYTQQVAYGKSVAPSRLFIYKVARRLDFLNGDTGAHLRTVMKALAAIGSPPEKYKPYVAGIGWDVEPDAFLYALAQEFNAMKYYRLDPVGRTEEEVLAAIKANLDAKLPVMGGFVVYENIEESETNGGYIPMPTVRKELGGHAIVIVGYDDSMKAFKIRNSWGPTWGVQGYGWLPYDYVLQGLAWDFWSLVEAGFVDMAQFDE